MIEQSGPIKVIKPEDSSTLGGKAITGQLSPELNFNYLNLANVKKEANISSSVNLNPSPMQSFRSKAEGNTNLAFPNIN
jgi:hypothetical protein